MNDYKEQTSMDELEYNRRLIQGRKFELFKRDPAAMVMEGLLKRDEVPDEVYALLSNGGLDDKWNTSVWRTAELGGESFKGGPFSSIVLGGLPKAVVDGRKGFGCELKKSHGFEEGYRIITVLGNDIPIIIKPDLLNLNDERIVKNCIWEIVKKEILKRGKTEKGWSPAAPAKEPKEIAFIYRTDEETFRSHLNWYDLHMGIDTDYITPKGLNFRQIAFFHKHPEIPEKARKEFLEKETKIRFANFGRTRKGVIGFPVEGEDAVEKAVKQMYKAVHRKPYPALKRVKLGLYKCPEHEVCPANCKHLKDWYKKYDKQNSMSRGIRRTNPEEEFEYMREDLPAKSKGRKSIGLTKLEEEN